MPDWVVAVFAIAGGFVLSGIVTSIHAIAHGDGVQFRASFASVGQGCWSVALSAFGGPVIVAANAWRLWRDSVIGAPAMALAGLIAGVWSFCAGVLVLQLLALAGVIHAG